MTSQANAYYANKLKERELNEVSVPKQRLAERTFEEVDKPKLRETIRSNLVNEDIKKKEYDEKVRAKDLDEAFRRDTTLDVPQQLSENLNKNMATVAKGGLDRMAAYAAFVGTKSLIEGASDDAEARKAERERQKLLSASMSGVTHAPGAQYYSDPQRLDFQAALRGTSRALK